MPKRRRSTFPAAIALDLQRALRKLLKQVTDEVQLELARKVKPILDTNATLLQTKAFTHGIGDDLRAIFVRIREFVKGLIPDTLLSKIASDATARAQDAAARDVNRQVKAVLGRAVASEVILPTRKLRAISEARVTESVRLIKDLPDEYINRVERIVYNALERGTSYDGLKETLADEIGIADDRAKRIAVDQINRTYSAMTRDRYEELGVRHAVWITAVDERVCPICEPLHEKRFTVAKLESEGWPPRHVSCRCTTIADPDELRVAFEALP